MFFWWGKVTLVDFIALKIISVNFTIKSLSFYSINLLVTSKKNRLICMNDSN